MEIILIRHTTPDIKKGICYGQSNIGVTNTFEEEANLIKKELLHNSSKTIYFSSPLNRCKLLAKELSDKIIYDNRLKELNFGDWELKKWNDIDKEELDIWMKDFVHVKTTNGESYIELQTRTVQFINEIKQLDAERIVVITHAGLSLIHI